MRAAYIVGALLAFVASPVLVAPPATAATLFGLVDTGELYASTNGGVSWTIRSTLPVRDAVALIAGATTSQLYLASETGSIYRSTNGGTSWSALAAVTASDVIAMAGQPGRILLVTRSGGVYASVDNGTTFTATGTITASDLVSIARHANSLVAITETGSVYRSTDNGANWSGVGSIAVSDAIEIASFANQLYVLTATGDVAKSADLGASWSFVSTLSQSGMTAMLATSTELIVTTAGGEAAATSNGTSWTWRGAIGQINVRALANDTPTLVGVDGSPLGELSLAAPWPNPARERASLAVRLDRAREVTLEVVDIAGRVIARPVPGLRLPAGPSVFEWRPTGVGSGVYFVRLRAGESEITHRLVWFGTP